MRRLSILGSTGSIGTQALEVITSLPGEFQIVSLTAGKNASLLAEQAVEFRVSAVAIINYSAASEVQERLHGTGIEVLAGREGLLEIAGRDDVDLCLNGLVGGTGMAPTIATLDAGVDVALANKESMVMAGAYITELAKKKTGPDLPGGQRTQRHLAMSGGRRPGPGSAIDPHRFRWSFSQLAQGAVDPGDQKPGLETSQLGHGAQDHHRFGHHDEQGAGGH